MSKLLEMNGVAKFNEVRDQREKKKKMEIQSKDTEPVAASTINFYKKNLL